MQGKSGCALCTWGPFQRGSIHLHLTILAFLRMLSMIGMYGVVSVFPSRSLQLQTTRSWDFMGFSVTVKRNPPVESDVIIDILDGGIWAESESFSDDGFVPPPQKWKGACKGGQNFTCNNKIIGARYYVAHGSAWDDTDGHGAHVESIAVGNQVIGAIFYGLAKFCLFVIFSRIPFSFSGLGIRSLE